MMVCTKRVLLVVLLAVVAASATKCLTHFWRCSAEADYESARINLKLDEEGAPDESPTLVETDALTNSVKRNLWQGMKDSLTSTYRKGTDAVKRPYRETRHMVANMPEYIKALIVFQLATIVDAILVWIVIAIFLLKVFWWASGKLLNAWIDGPSASRAPSDSAVDVFPNGDVIVHLGQIKFGGAK